MDLHPYDIVRHDITCHNTMCHILIFTSMGIPSPHSKGENLVGSKFCGVFATFVLDVVMAQPVVKTFETTLTMY